MGSVHETTPTEVVETGVGQDTWELVVQAGDAFLLKAFTLQEAVLQFRQWTDRAGVSDLPEWEPVAIHPIEGHILLRVEEKNIDKVPK